MAEQKNSAFCGKDKETVILHANRVVDSCRDKDCFENVKVFLGECGNDCLEKTNNIRVKCTEVLWTSLNIEPVKFNKDFYSISIKFYVKLVFEACLYHGKVAEFEGLAICDKKVILFGGKGGVNIFRSDECCDFCCDSNCCELKSSNLPFAVCEVADPIALNVSVHPHENYCDCCCIDEIPEHVHGCLDCKLLEFDDMCKKVLCVTLGFFSIIKVERPGQFLVSATEYCIPEKECMCQEIDPCSVFKHMDFPVNEFCTSPTPKKQSTHKSSIFGCKG